MQVTRWARSADLERLALRLRLPSAELGEDLRAAHAQLLGQGHLGANGDQEKAVHCLAQLPEALRGARKQKEQWDAEQRRLSLEAKQRDARVSQEERLKAAAWTSTWMSRSPSTPSAPRILGPICWLRVGPPPALTPAGCYIYGTVGTGKSTIMDLFCLTLPAWRVKRQHFHEFALGLHQDLHAMRSSGKEPQRHILERLADKVSESCDVLCLDEFAITNVADAAIMAELLQLLAVRHVAVVCTTNRPPEDLYKEGLHRERYVPPMVDHIRQKFLVQGVLGADYRSAMLEAEVVDEAKAKEVVTVFEGGSAEAVAKLMPEFAATALSQDDLQVSWNRRLPVQSAHGFARFHFDDLCRRALAAEDFWIVASTYHTVLVHDIPRLSVEEHNEARRFTNLVDALYEHSVCLVVHCQGQLEEVLRNIQVLQGAENESLDASSLGVFETMYDDSPNFQIQIKELGREKWEQLQSAKIAEEQRSHAQRMQRLGNVESLEGDVGSGWSTAPASADLSAPDQGVAGVMVAAVGSLQESGFAAKRATSRLREMQTAPYLEAAMRRRHAWS